MMHTHTILVCRLFAEYQQHVTRMYVYILCTLHGVLYVYIRIAYADSRTHSGSMKHTMWDCSFIFINEWCCTIPRKGVLLSYQGYALRTHLSCICVILCILYNIHKTVNTYNIRSHITVRVLYLNNQRRVSYPVSALFVYFFCMHSVYAFSRKGVFRTRNRYCYL